MSRHSAEPEPNLTVEPRSSDNEGEQQGSPLPPVSEEPTAPLVTEEALTAKGDDAGVSSGLDLGRVDPAHMAEFEKLLGQRVFGPNVAGSSLSVTGSDE
jgi:hypothetical protein